MSKAATIHDSNKLTKEQKESVFLLSVGTFLEYFDLMLYVHMSAILNEVFFPKTDPIVANILAIFTFGAAFMLRPIGGLIVGWIGDHIGRKNTIIITTFVMAFCCFTIAIMPTYAELGITASIMIVVIRIIQSFTSAGEVIGAKLYLVETLKQPNRYVCSAVIGLVLTSGGLFALIIAYLSTAFAFNWRIAFWIGAVIAMIGLMARTKLRETPDFVNYQRRLKMKRELISCDDSLKQPKNEKVDKKAVTSYFMMCLLRPIGFYIAYIYSGAFMQESLGMSAGEVIKQNLKIGFLITMESLSKIV